MESYFACLYREIEGRGRELKDKVFDTIYIGGGTPSIAPENYIVGVIKQVKKFFNLANDLEITIEINPGTIDEKKVKAYKQIGINLIKKLEYIIPLLIVTIASYGYLLTHSTVNVDVLSSDLSLNLGEGNKNQIELDHKNHGYYTY